MLIDFGIAHVPDATRITQAGMFMGTPGYLAPEVVEGQPCGPSADVHSWASTVAFAATGRPPFGTGSYETIFYRIIGGHPDLDGIPGKLMALLTAALSRDPAARPSAVQLSEKCAAIDLTGADETLPRPGRVGQRLATAGGAHVAAGHGLSAPRRFAAAGGRLGAAAGAARTEPPAGPRLPEGRSAAAIRGGALPRPTEGRARRTVAASASAARKVVCPGFWQPRS